MTVRDGLRIAMWSGPRNISTAMMRAWENRGDTAVTDEPFYAHYLQATGVNHPGREEVLASQSTDAVEVAAMLTGPIPGGKPFALTTSPPGLSIRCRSRHPSLRPTTPAPRF